MAKPSAVKPPPLSSIIRANSDTGAMQTALASSNVMATPKSTVAPLAPVVAAANDGVQQRTQQVWPVSRIQVSPMNARVFYSTEEVDEMATSLTTNGQELAVKGYIEGDNLILIDGQKRLRGAKAGGLDTLVADVCEKPEKERDVYLASRRINKERSSQTALDDGVRFKMLLEEKHFQDQDELAQTLGMSKSMISKVMSLNAIPERVMRRLKDTKITESINALYAISQLFSAESKEGEEGAVELATAIIEEAVKKDLSGNQVVTLVAAKRQGPKQRQRNEVRRVTMGSAPGVLKLSPSRGVIEFSMQGLTAEQVNQLRDRIESICETGLDPAPSAAA